MVINLIFPFKITLKFITIHIIYYRMSNMPQVYNLSHPLDHGELRSRDHLSSPADFFLYNQLHTIP